MATSKEFEAPEVLRRRQALQAEINRNCYKPKEFSGERWKKTPEEKLVLANAVLRHRQDMRKDGLNHKKRMNVYEPVHARIW